MPENIRPARGVNKFSGVGYLGAALIIGFPVCLAFYYDGIASILDWPPLFNWLTGFTALFIFTGAYLIVMPQRVGVDVHFLETGFSLRIRLYFRKEQEHHFNWADIKEIVKLKGASNSDQLTIRPINLASVSFPIRFVEPSVSETFARFRVSVEAAGYRLERTGSFNALIIAKQTWRVSQQEQIRVRSGK